MEVTIARGEFAGKPLLVIHDAAAKEGDKAIISFGMKKAEAILASVKEIEKFVEENKKGK